MQISFFIAKRYVKKQKKTRLIRRLSMLSCYSIALGTAILVFVLSTMNGMERFLSDLFYTYTPVLKIEPKIGKSFIADFTLKKNIMKLAGVTDIVEVLEATALVRLHHQQAIATIKGVSANFAASDFFKYCTRMDAHFFEQKSQLQAILGLSLARFLQWAPSKNRIEIFYPKKNGYRLNKPYTCLTLPICGLFSITKKIDGRYMIAPIDFVEKLTGLLYKRSYWEVVVQDRADLKKIQTGIQKLLPAGCKVSNREEQNETRRRAIRIERLSVFCMLALVLLVASLHIFFMLCMLVVHKQQDVAILASLGFRQNQIGKIFLYNGLLVSLEGIIYGLVLGWLLSFLQQQFEIITFNTTPTRNVYPIAIEGFDFLYVAILTIFFTFLAALWPVKRAMALAKKI